MMNKLDSLQVIDRAALRSDRYFLSLAEQGYKAGMLSDGDAERIRTELFMLLGEICSEIAKKGTSSVKIDTAEEISESILYTVSLCLKNCSSPEEAVRLLQKEKISAIFDIGRDILSDIFINTRAKWTLLQKKLFKTESKSFNETIYTEMKSFFASYDRKLFSHNSVILFDYPIYIKPEKLIGIEYVSKRLDGFICENDFLCNFEPKAVHELLLKLDDIFGKGDEGEAFYVNAPVNVYFYVFASALGLVFCGKAPLDLDFEKNDYDFVCDELMKKSPEAIHAALSNALTVLSGTVEMSGEVRRYAELSVRKFADEIILTKHRKERKAAADT